MACKTGFPLLSVSVVRSNEVELDELDQQIRGSACFISRHSFKDMAFQENGIGTIRLLEQHLPCARLKRLLVHVSSMGVTAIRTTRLLSLFHLDNGTHHHPPAREFTFFCSKIHHTFSINACYRVPDPRRPPSSTFRNENDKNDCRPTSTTLLSSSLRAPFVPPPTTSLTHHAHNSHHVAPHSHPHVLIFFSRLLS